MTTPSAYPSTTRRARHLLDLASAAVPFCAWVLGYRDPHTGRMRPLVQTGYRPDVVDYIFGEFAGHPLVRRLMTQPGTAYFWEDVSGFADEAVAREVLRPCGFAEGTSMALRGADGQPVGIAHLSLPEPSVPAHARAVLGSLSPALGDLAATTARAAALALTPRELEILGLLARGRTNPQIGADLVLSRSTVGTHVEHILAKMGVTTRVEAVAIGIGLGLVDA